MGCKLNVLAYLPSMREKKREMIKPQFAIETSQINQNLLNWMREEVQRNGVKYGEERVFAITSVRKI